ncbi:MAG: hypothetical protein K9J77_01195 [Rhodoferax sp.]|nr:hypothetical protein [Rhodoferax sp.]
MILHNRKQLGFEVKLTRFPMLTPSMRAAQSALQLDHLYVACHAMGTRQTSPGLWQKASAPGDYRLRLD